MQVLPVFIDDAYRPEGALRQTLRMIEAAHRIAEANADEVASAWTEPTSTQRSAPDTSPSCWRWRAAPPSTPTWSCWQTMHRLGVRVASLTHFGRTALADGSGEDATGGRLTRAGVAAVAEMERLGILFDVSHLGAAGVDHVLELATRPVIATHSSARALRDHHRNLTDAQLKAIAAGGGVVCVNFFAGFLDATEHTVDRLVDHIEHVASAAGIEHVGIGPDFLKEIEDEVWPAWRDDYIIEGIDVRSCVPGLEGPPRVAVGHRRPPGARLRPRRRDQGDGRQRRALAACRARSAVRQRERRRRSALTTGDVAPVEGGEDGDAEVFVDIAWIEHVGVEQARGDGVDGPRQLVGVHRQRYTALGGAGLQGPCQPAVIGADLPGVLGPLARSTHEEQVELPGQQQLRR